MNDKGIFVDTNLLVYAHDTKAGQSHRRAREIIATLWGQLPLPAISVQVLQEFYINLIRKGIQTSLAQKIVLNYTSWQLIENDLPLFQLGLDLHQRWKLSFWDGMILAAAKIADVKELWSEDFQAGQDFDGLTTVNPLIT